jgi:translation initiation factor eIF-2B subunit gamma
LPSPKPDLIAPEDLDQTTGTAQIFRLPEVRKEIKGDFIVLPCDIVCELGGEALLETWMIKEAGLGGATGGGEEFQGPKMAVGGEKGGRRGGLGVWYETKIEVPKGELAVKGEETDFLATAPVDKGPVPFHEGSLLRHTSQVVYSFPTDTLNDIVEIKNMLPIRQSLVRKHGNVRMLTTHRDAHIYIFPAWVLDMINANDDMDNLSEDVIGWWAKSGWQSGFADRLGLRSIFYGSPPPIHSDLNGSKDLPDTDIDIASLSTTTISTSQSLRADTSISTTHRSPEIHSQDGTTGLPTPAPFTVPPFLAYIQPAQPYGSSPIIRRVDTAPLLLNISLQLAKLEALDQVSKAAASPFAHASKVAYPGGIASRCTVTRQDCLLADNVTVEERSAIKECVVGANCQIGEGAKLFRCVLMEGVVVGKGCKISGSILGRRSVIGADSVLQDCEVEDNMRIETESKFFPPLSAPQSPQQDYHKCTFFVGDYIN